MRSIWTGAISFGLVNIPVKLYSAVKDSDLDLDMLDSRDHSNIKFKRVNERTGKEVPYSEIAKAYLYKEHYVVLDKEDFENADAKKSKLIEIMNFTNASEIDSIYFEQPFYLEPEKSGAKSYAILRDALKDENKVGITTFVLRNKETLAILKPIGKVIVLNRMRFKEEIRSVEGLNLPAVIKARPKELEMATKLIEQLTEKFDVSGYHNKYSEKLMKIIQAKAKGKKISPKRMKIVHTKNDDLMEMLKASLSKKKKAS